MRWIAILFAILTFAPVTAYAETVYLTDKLYVGLREGQGDEYPVAKSVVSGTALEVLQRLNGFTLVREPGGVEGWVADRYLVSTAPAAAGTNELRKTRSALQAAKTKLAAERKKSQEQGKRTQELEEKIKQLQQAETDSVASGTVGEYSREGIRPLPAVSAGTEHFQFHWLWFLIAFAMLVTGFVFGVVWLRELNRKKMGGMYLRI